MKNNLGMKANKHTNKERITRGRNTKQEQKTQTDVDQFSHTKLRRSHSHPDSGESKDHLDNESMKE